MHISQIIFYYFQINVLDTCHVLYTEVKSIVKSYQFGCILVVCLLFLQNNYR